MNDAHQRSECGTLVRRILVPLYRVRDTYPAFDRALQVAQMFEAGLLIAAVVDKGSFTVLGGAPAAGGPVVATDRKHLALSRAELTRQIRFLAEQANELGVQAETTAVVGSASDEVVQLSRYCDLIIETEFHRRPLLGNTPTLQGGYLQGCCMPDPRGQRRALRKWADSPYLFPLTEGKPGLTLGRPPCRRRRLDA